MEPNCNSYYKKRHRYKGMGWAILLICAGVLFLLFNLNIIPAVYKPLLISWQMLLIAIGTWSLIKRHFTAGAILIAIGGIFIYPIVCSVFPGILPLCMDFNIKALWPVVLIIVGLSIIVAKINPFRKHNSKFNKRRGHRSDCNLSDNAYHSDSEYIDKDLAFGEAKQIVLSQNFKGGKADVVFGGLEIDLRKAKLSETGAFLEINAVFGGITVLAPSDWDIELGGDSFFGGYTDKRSFYGENEMNPNTPKLIIKATSVFGGGEIKN